MNNPNIKFWNKITEILKKDELSLLDKQMQLEKELQSSASEIQSSAQGLFSNKAYLICIDIVTEWVKTSLNNLKLIPYAPLTELEMQEFSAIEIKRYKSRAAYREKQLLGRTPKDLFTKYILKFCEEHFVSQTATHLLYELNKSFSTNVSFRTNTQLSIICSNVVNSLLSGVYTKLISDVKDIMKSNSITPDYSTQIEYNGVTLKPIEFIKDCDLLNMNIGDSKGIIKEDDAHIISHALKEITGVKFNLLFCRIIAALSEKNFKNYNIDLESLLYENIEVLPMVKALLELLIGHKIVIANDKTRAREITHYNLGIEFLDQSYFSNFPLVTPPRDWTFNKNDYNHISGGFHTTSYLDVLMFNTLSLSQSRNFHITPSQRLLDLINKLQKVSFKVNKSLLNYIDQNYAKLVSNGFLSDFSVVGVPVRERLAALINPLSEQELKAFPYSSTKRNFIKENSEARRDFNIIETARLFVDQIIYFPAFLDWRGRIYRPGFLSMQSTQLAKNLILFNSNNTVEPKASNVNLALYAFAASVKKWKSITEAIHWASTTVKSGSFEAPQPSFEDPFLYINYTQLEPAFYIQDDKIYLTDHGRNIPIRLDATSSVYQILSFLSCNEEVAVHTNVISFKEDFYEDIYEYIRQGLIEELDQKVADGSLKTTTYTSGTPVFSEPSLQIFIKSYNKIYDRTFVKAFAMPMAYGMTLMTGFDKAQEVLSSLLPAYSDENLHKAVAFILFNYIKKQLKPCWNYFDLLTNFSALGSSLDLPITWSHEMAKIRQSYKGTEDQRITIFTKRGALRHKRLTLNIRLNNKGISVRKNSSSIAPNFIHSLDALILFKMIEIYFNNNQSAKFASVHDCFITSTDSFSEISIRDLYRTVLVQIFSNPLVILNNLINDTLKLQLTQEDLMKPIPLDLINQKVLFYYDIKTKLGIKTYGGIQDKLDRFTSSYFNYIDKIENNNSFIKKVLTNKGHLLS